MDNMNKSSRRIHILRDDVARKIAAGEVIDRPFSVVRELLDNSLDAGASELSLFIEDGGISRIRVVDNGHGMSREDLEHCFLPHATSKILNAEDIYNITTLGFRGEALSAIATCSLLEIISAQDIAQYGHRLIVQGGKLVSLEEHKSRKGTIVDVKSLFFNMPGRKNFLKSKAGESSLCRTTFLDKALPFPDVSFRFSVNGNMKLFFPSETTLKRVTSVFSDMFPAGVFEYLEETGEDFSIKMVAARPEVHRNDRKYILIFINRRRVFEYACIQAIEYGYSGFMPGKDHPVACVFIDINPKLVDFNIHPAKRECKIKILPRIHQGIVSTIKSFVQGFSITIEKPQTSYNQHTDQTLEDFYKKGFTVNEQSPAYSTFPGSGNLDVHLNDLTEKDTAAGTLPRVVGQVFGLFIIASYRDSLYIIDQHAAHERLLYEELKNQESVAQDLLFPVVFDVTQEEEELLQKQLSFLLQKGIKLEKAGEGCFEITALPSHFHDIDTKEIVSFLKNLEGHTGGLEHHLNSLAACRKAIKDGDPVDHLTAQKLVNKIFLLENARCPHGRPIWHVITKEQLLKLMGRK
ncbi:MAG: DNA mismatch repair endonuclease MutL [Spirochaetales bacterium]|nr:DNA mismatch repair endonuclease MutL [Spirochaetales bacterium]